jgi:hypothetical protein
MEHRDDLEKVLLAGLPTVEQEQVLQAIDKTTVEKLAAKRGEAASNRPGKKPPNGASEHGSGVDRGLRVRPDDVDQPCVIPPAPRR